MTVLMYAHFAWWLLSFIGPFFVKFPRNPFFIAIAIAPFVFITQDAKELNAGAFKRLQRHERRHIWQQRWFGPVLFLLLYGLMFIVNYIKERNYFRAYWKIWFEEDARQHEKRGCE